MATDALKTSLGIAARLPWRALYGISDVAAFVLRRMVRYRRRVVHDNLAAAFPEASPALLRRYERDFYRNFTDSFIETLKLLHVSDDEMMRRMEFVDTDIIDRLLAEGRSIVVYFGHFFNWEWAPSVSLHTARRPGEGVVFAQVYRPLRSKAFDRLMLGIRSRFGSESIDKATTLRRLITIRREGMQSITGFMSDQHPSHGDPGYITTLLGRPTAMITGTETLARKLGMAVIYWDMDKTSRGRYRITTRLIADDASLLPQGSITARYTSLLESTIRRNPPLWLWSHNRWKHPVTPKP